MSKDLWERRGAVFLVSRLTNPDFDKKAFVTLAMNDPESEEAIGAVIKRLRQILNTRKRVYCYHTGETELTDCLEFLHRHREHPKVVKIFERTREKWDVLDDREIWWIVDQLEAFADGDLRGKPFQLPPIEHPLKGDHPVFLAAQQNDGVMVANALDNGVSVYAKAWPEGGSLAEQAIRSGALAVLKLLAERGLNLERPVHGNLDLPICIAADSGQREIVSFLLDQGIDLEKPNFYGTPVSQLVRKRAMGAGHPEIAALVASG